MIIWGSKGKEKTIGRGEFHCPACNASSPYLHRRVARYFTLYFIPICRTSILGEYIACQRCSNSFSVEILSLSAEQIQAILEPWPCEMCGNVNPPSEEACMGCKAARSATPATAS